jgi:hypothetical protein
MDLKRLDSVTKSEAGVWMDIINPDGDETGIQILVKGIDSKAFKSQSNAIRKYVQQQKEKGKTPVNSEMDAKSIQMLAAVTAGWRDTSEEGVKLKADADGLIMDGEVWKFNTENAITIYTAIPFIADQVASFTMKRANFLDL